jgi:chromosomal replication initiator protein
MALCSVRECPVSMELAEHAVRGYFPERRREISPVFIQNMVAERYSVTLNDILGKRRTQNIAFARQVAMFLCRKHTGCSYPEIGALFGGRDHSTVIHAQRVIDEKQGLNTQFKTDLEALSKKITSNV